MERALGAWVVMVVMVARMMTKTVTVIAMASRFEGEVVHDALERWEQLEQ